MEEKIPPIYTAYNILELKYPEADIHELSGILFSRKDALEGLVEIPKIERTELGMLCEDWRDYRKNLFVSAGEGKERKKYLKKQISEAVSSDFYRTTELCEILGLDLFEVI